MLFFKRKNSFKQSFKRFFGPIERLENREQPGSLFGVDAMFSPMITSLLDVPTEPISDTTIVNSPVAQPEFLDTSLEAQNSTQAVSSITEFTIISDTSTVSSDAQVDAGFTTLSNETGTGVGVSADPFAAIFAASVFGGNALSGVSVSPSMDVNSGTTGNVVTPISDLDGLTLPTLNIAGLDGAPESSADSLFAAINGAGLVAGMDNASTPILDGGSSSGGDGAGNQGSSTVTINFPTPVLNPLNPIIEMNPLMPLPPGAGDLVGVNIAGIDQNPVAPANPVQNNNNPVVNNQANPVNPDVQLDGGIGNGGALLGVGLLGSDFNSGDYGTGGVGIGLPGQNIANGVLPNGVVDPQLIAGAVGAGQIAAAANNVNQFILPGAGPLGSNLYNPSANVSSGLGTFGSPVPPTTITTIQPGQQPPITVDAPLGTVYDLISSNENTRKFDPALGSTFLQAIQSGDIPIAYTYQEIFGGNTPGTDGNDLPIYPNQNLPVTYNQMFQLNGNLVSPIDRDWIKFTLDQRAGVFIQLNTTQIYPFNVRSGLANPILSLYDATGLNGVDIENDLQAFTPIASSSDGYIIGEMVTLGGVPRIQANYPINSRIGPNALGVHSLGGSLVSSQFESDGLAGAYSATGSNPVSDRTDPVIYRDLGPGTYFLQIISPNNQRTNENLETGLWQLDFFLDTGYTTNAPDYNSNPGAENSIFLNYSGGNGFAPYEVAPSLSNPTSVGEFSPIEQIGIYNTFRIVHEDFSPFNVNVTTNRANYATSPSNFQVYVTSSAVSSASGLYNLGDYLGSNIGVVSQANFNANFLSYGADNGNISSGLSYYPTAQALELGNSISNVIGYGCGIRNNGYSIGGDLLSDYTLGGNFSGYDRVSDYTLSSSALVSLDNSRNPAIPGNPNHVDLLNGVLAQSNDTGSVVTNPQTAIDRLEAPFFPSGSADDRIMSNAVDVYSSTNAANQKTVGDFSDAGFSREIWDATDYDSLVAVFGARPDDVGNTPFNPLTLVYDEDTRTYSYNGVISSNTDDDWFKISGSGLATISVDTDEFSGNLTPVVQVWAFDPEFYRPQRITSYISYSYNDGTFSIERKLVGLPLEREYFIQLGNAYSVNSAKDPNGTPINTPNSLIAGHYRLIVEISQ